MTESELKYIIARVLESAMEAAKEARENPEDEFCKGRRLAYYEVLDTVKNELSCRVVRVAIQNFLKNQVISTVFGFRATDFLACNFIIEP